MSFFFFLLTLADSSLHPALKKSSLLKSQAELVKEKEEIQKAAGEEDWEIDTLTAPEVRGILKKLEVLIFFFF